MVSRDYTKEVGLPSHEGMVPLPVAIAIIAAIAFGAWYGMTSVDNRHAASKTAAADPAAVQVSARN